MHSTRNVDPPPLAETATGPGARSAAPGAARPAALGVRLRYSFEPGQQLAAALDNPLLELLAAVAAGGSIRHAARSLGTSYRYVWDALRKWERLLGEPLIGWAQGRRARPTSFALKLLWAERQVRTRMQPEIETLRADLARVLVDAQDERHPLLTMRASHDIALLVLQQHMADATNLHLDLGFQGSVDALRALSERRCLAAGFHVPTLPRSAPVFVKAFKPWLKPSLQKLIACSRRTQGLMVRKEHAPLVHSLADVARHGLRFVNRQSGSGTRILIEHLVQVHAVVPASLSGYADHVEHTHTAVALCVASRVADAGVGIEAAALQFGLHFIPLVEEDYFLACLGSDVGAPAIERLREVLAGPRWREILGSLPGYEPAVAPGELLVIDEVLPWWRRTRSNARALRRDPQ
jgi:putative molybdopterin biosynthesis protein